MMTDSSSKNTRAQPPLGPDRSALATQVTFMLVAGVLLALYETPFATGALAAAMATYLRIYAAAAGAVLHVFDRTVSVYGDVVIGRSSVRIVRGCDAAEMMILYAAAVVAKHDFTLARRALGVLVGTAMLMTANIARICCMYALILYVPSCVDTFHYEVFPLILVLLALGIYVAWLRWFAAPGEVTS